MQATPVASAAAKKVPAAGTAGKKPAAKSDAPGKKKEEAVESTPVADPVAEAEAARLKAE